MQLPTPSRSRSVTLALKHEQLGKRSCPCAQIACLLSLFAPCAQRGIFEGQVLCRCARSLVFPEKGSP